MLKKILIALIVAVAVFAAYVAFLPSDFQVFRSTVIKAPPEAVFPHVNDLKKWDNWSPWAKRDPDAKVSHAGADSGKGAVFKWAGDETVGEGQMTIVESTPHEAIAIELEFIQPFPGKSDVHFTFEPVDEGTSVTWSLSGQQGYLERAMCILMGVDMDDMIGADYEKGLAALKKVVEGGGA